MSLIINYCHQPFNSQICHIFRFIEYWYIFCHSSLTSKTLLMVVKCTLKQRYEAVGLSLLVWDLSSIPERTQMELGWCWSMAAPHRENNQLDICSFNLSAHVSAPEWNTGQTLGASHERWWAVSFPCGNINLNVLVCLKCVPVSRESLCSHNDNKDSSLAAALKFQQGAVWPFASPLDSGFRLPLTSTWFFKNK